MKLTSQVTKRKLLGALVGLVVGGLALTGCAGGGGGSNEAASKVLRVSNTFAPLSMDPAFSGNGRMGTMLHPAYEPLVRIQADGTLAPALATAWEMSADNRSVTFTLRDDAKFSSGEAVDAEAVKASIEYWVAKEGPFSVNLKGLKSIDVVDAHTVTVTLETPNPELPTVFSTYWLAGDIISTEGLENADKLASETFGAGPYVLDSAKTVSGKTYEYLPNENYYDQSAIEWDKIVISVYEDQNSAVQAFKAGQLDLMVSDPMTGNANEGSLPDTARLITDPVQWTGLILGDREGEVVPALADVRVRQAINYALDRDTLTTALFGNFGTPTAQLQSEGFVGHDPANDGFYSFDLAKAKTLMKEAGYSDGFKMDVGYVVNTLNQGQAQAIAGQLAEIGIEVNFVESQNIGEQDIKTANDELPALIGQSNSGTPFMSKFQTLMPGGSWNTFDTEDPELTELLEAASALPSDQSTEAWEAVHKWVTENAWFGIISSLHVTYFAADTIDAPNPGQSLVIDMFDVRPAK